MGVASSAARNGEGRGTRKHSTHRADHGKGHRHVHDSDMNASVTTWSKSHARSPTPTATNPLLAESGLTPSPARNCLALLTEKGAEGGDLSLTSSASGDGVPAAKPKQHAQQQHSSVRLAKGDATGSSSPLPLAPAAQKPVRAAVATPQTAKARGGGGPSRPASGGAASSSSIFAKVHMDDTFAEHRSEALAKEDGSAALRSPRHPISNGGGRLRQSGDRSDSMLSDISVSEMSATWQNDSASRNSMSLGPGAGPLLSGVKPSGAPAAAGPLFARGDDLEQQRQQAPLSIEEDLFIYDDIVISKDEARTKHWRLAGRKPPPMALAAVGGESAAVDGTGKRFSTGSGLSSDAGRHYFVFNDFDVCVDEMDLAPSSTNAAKAVAAYQRELTNSSSSLFLERSLQHDAAAESALPGTAIEGVWGSATSLGASGGAAEASLSGSGTGAVCTPADAAMHSGSNAAGAASTSPGTGSTADNSGGQTAARVGGGINAVAAAAAIVNRPQQRRVVNAAMRMSVISTASMAPNTAKAHEEKRKATARTSGRELKQFTAEAVLGHASRVKCIALAPGEREFASCSNADASVALSSLGVRDEVGIFTGHQDTVINVAFSPDGKYLATTSKDRTMILWDVMTAKQLLTFSHAKVVICCCFSPDSKYLVSGCQDRVCRLWDTRRGKEWLTYTHHEAIIISVAFSPCGGYVCSASADKTLRVWSSTTAKTRFTLTGHVGIILSCSYTTDGRFIVSNDESLLRVWSTVDGTCTLSLTAADVAGATHLSPKGPKLGWTLSCAAPGAFTQYICVACNNRFVYILDRETGKEVSSTFCKAPVYCLTSGTEELAACGDSFGNIYLLHMR